MFTIPTLYVTRKYISQSQGGRIYVIPTLGGILYSILILRIRFLSRTSFETTSMSHDDHERNTFPIHLLQNTIWISWFKSYED